MPSATQTRRSGDRQRGAKPPSARRSYPKKSSSKGPQILVTPTSAKSALVRRTESDHMVRSLPHPSAESHTVPSRWPVRKGISSGCLIEQLYALTDQALLSDCYTKKKSDHGIDPGRAIAKQSDPRQAGVRTGAKLARARMLYNHRSFECKVMDARRLTRSHSHRSTTTEAPRGIRVRRTM